MNKVHQVGWLLAITLVTVGCSDPVMAPPTMRGDPVAGAYPQQIAIEGLHEELVTDEPIVTPGTDKRPMSVSVPLRSVNDGGPLKIQYKFTFLDSRGRPIRGQTNGWQYAVVPPLARVYAEAGALDTNAADWELIVRPSQVE